VFKINSKNL